MQSFHNLRKTATDRAERSYADESGPFSCQRWRVAGHSFTISGEFSAQFFVSPGWHLYVHSSGSRETLLKEKFVANEAEISPTPVFASCGYLQHASSEKSGEHRIQYHSDPTAENYDLPDPIASANRENMSLAPEKATISSESALNQHDGISDGDLVVGDVSTKRSDTENSESELSQLSR